MNKNRIIEDYLQGKHPIEQESWELPTAQELERDEALFESLMAQKKASSSLTPRPLRGERELKRRRLWPWVGLIAACVAGFVAIFLVPPREATIEPVEQPVVAQQVDKQLEPVVKEEPAETILEVAVPKKTRRAPKRKPVVQQEPIEEPMLAEAEAMPMPEQAEDPIEKAVRVRRELRQRGEQVEQYVAMLNERVKSEHHYVQF